MNMFVSAQLKEPGGMPIRVFGEGSNLTVFLVYMPTILSKKK